MAKRLFLLLMSSVLSVVAGADFLAVGEPVVVKAPEFNAVLTEELPEVLPEPEPVVHASAAPVTYATYVPYVPPANYIAILGRVLPVVEVADTGAESGSGVNKFGERFLYGHNTWNVFGGLDTVGVGQSFTVSLGGVAVNYVVAKVVVYEKDVAAGLLRLNGQGSYMWAVAHAVSDGVQYGLAVMTCAGQALGGGDATHRLVVFANVM